MNSNKLLLILTPQNDFIDGEDCIIGAKDIMDSIARLIDKHGQGYSDIAITMLEQPITLCFYKGEKPINCLRYSQGAAVYQPIMQSICNLISKNNNIHVSFFETRQSSTRDESAFFSVIRNKYLFLDLIKRRDIQQIDIVGVGGDECINISIDMIETGLQEKLNIIEDLCSSSDDGTKLHNFILRNSLKKY